jgi:hypothetical protein
MKTPLITITLPRNEWDKIAAVLFEDAHNKIDLSKRPCDPDTLIIYLETIKKQLRLARYLHAKLNQP